MIYKITLTSQTDYNYYVYADSVEEALEEFNDGEQFDEDQGDPVCIKKTWSLLNDEGEVIDDGVLTEEQLP